MALINRLLAVGSIRKMIWRLWYPYVTRRLRGDEVLFLNYGFEEDPPMNIPLRPEDEPDRACIQLYHHVATQASLPGKTVLEVSCGHGGGAAFLTRTLQPRRYTGLDLNPAAIEFCRQRHPVEGLSFETGDSEKLPFPENTFDAVINVEASHCYPSVPRFLGEVARVLRPGGHFLYADFRFPERMTEWDRALTGAPLQLLKSRNINAEVRRGIDRNSARSLQLIERHLPKFLHSTGRDFAGLKGSEVYEALVSGDLSYRSFCFAKAGANPKI
jgi:ubiquinone/menaquinone biosynthesis C-methylase UbiE